MLKIEQALDQHERRELRKRRRELLHQIQACEREINKTVYPRTAGGFREVMTTVLNIFSGSEILGPHPGEPGIVNLDPYELYLATMSVLYHDIGLLHQRKKYAEISAYLLEAENSGFL